VNRITYLLVLHAAAFAMSIPIGVVIIALGRLIQDMLSWFSDRVSRRFVRRVDSLAKPCKSLPRQKAQSKTANQQRKSHRLRPHPAVESPSAIATLQTKF
jgi:hypothetical protein